MKYRINLTDEDFIKFNIFHMNNSKIGKHTHNIIRAFCAFLFILCSFAFFTSCPAETPILIPIIETVILFAIVMVYLVFFEKKHVNRTTKLLIKKQKRDGALPYSKSSVIEFLDDEIFETTDIGTKHLPYDKIEKIFITDEEMYIYIDSQQAFLIPYSSLGDDKDLVLNYLKQKTNKF